MKKIIITMPASILVKYPQASRQLVWEPSSTPVMKRRFCFLQLGWSGGRSRAEKARNKAQGGRIRPAITA